MPLRTTFFTGESFDLFLNSYELDCTTSMMMGAIFSSSFIVPSASHCSSRPSCLVSGAVSEQQEGRRGRKGGDEREGKGGKGRKRRGKGEERERKGRGKGGKRKGRGKGEERERNHSLSFRLHGSI